MMTGQPYPPQDEDAQYENAWKKFEPSLNGSVTPSQFRQLMAELGELVNDAEVESLINNVDGEGKLSCKGLSPWLYCVKRDNKANWSSDITFVHFAKNRNVENDIVSGYE